MYLDKCSLLLETMEIIRWKCKVCVCVCVCKISISTMECQIYIECCTFCTENCFSTFFKERK
uniref:Uncharacterized protein n=1 Tax=Anguilla anguilla TaxID=7936 RepID=A0A0E9WNF0_ANGAN